MNIFFKTLGLGLLIFLDISTVIAQSPIQEHIKEYNRQFQQEQKNSKKDKVYRRWEYFVGPRTYPDKDMIPSDMMLHEYAKIKQQKLMKTTTANEASWQYVGPTSLPQNGGGAGRLNCLAFDPINSDVIWVGAPEGGLWKSLDGGLSWNTNTDLLPNIGVTDIAIHPTNPDIMYIATGDGFGYPISGFFWGGKYSNGVMKSIDGGLTWSNTGLNFSVLQAHQIFRLILDENNPNTLLVSSSEGIYKSTDAGSTWNLKITGDIRDLKFHSTNSSIIYATSANGNFLRSINNGNNWTSVFDFSSGTGSGYGVLGTTIANPDLIYLWTNNAKLYKSLNQGQNWVLISTTWMYPSWYYQAIAVSSTDANIVYLGSLDIVKSTNGGVDFNLISNSAGYGGSDYVHADTREISFHPNFPNIVYSINDGGIFLSSDNGTTWVDHSSGLDVLQLYRFSNNQTDPNHMILGAQDNGQNQLKSSVWEQIFLADGMESVIHPSNSDTIYVQWQFGATEKSIDGGITFTSLNGPAGNWLAPLIMHPTELNTLYSSGEHDTLGYQSLIKTVDGGAIWSSITNMSLSGSPDGIAQCKLSPNHLYFYTGNAWIGNNIQFYKTSDDGINWTNITSGLPVFGAYPTYIAVHDTNPNIAWVTFSGYDNNSKVYKTEDGGSSWQNISGDLPQVPVNCVVYDQGSYNGIYVGTDLGVYFICDTMAQWLYYNDGMPNVVVNELEIIRSTQTLRAATYGRGVWETPLLNVQTGFNKAKVAQKHDFLVFPSISTGLFSYKMTSKDPLKLEVYTLSGVKMKDLSIKAGKTIDLSDLQNGLYLLKSTQNHEVYTQKVIISH